MFIQADTDFHRAKDHLASVKICRRGQWNVRMIVETVFSMMSVASHTKQVRHRVWDGFEAHLAYTMAAFNILARWNGLQSNDQGKILISIVRSTL